MAHIDQLNGWIVALQGGHARLDIAPLLAEAKRQLHEEADYRREAAQMQRYGYLLAGDPAFVMPQPVEARSGDRILAMDFIPGSPIETLEHARTRPAMRP